MSINMIVLSGNLGGPPEERVVESGKRFCTLRLANNRWDSRTKAEVTDWYSVSVFGTTADFCLKHLTKGSSIVVEGRVALRDYEKEGRKGRTVEISANRVSFFGSKAANGVRPPEEQLEPVGIEAVPF